MTQYVQNSQRERLFYAEEVARRLRTARRASRSSLGEAQLKPIPSNSTPWIESPRTLEELISIADSVARLAEEWREPA
jgi:hypothetical protein